MYIPVTMGVVLLDWRELVEHDRGERTPLNLPHVPNWATLLGILSPLLQMETVIWISVQNFWFCLPFLVSAYDVNRTLLNCRFARYLETVTQLYKVPHLTMKWNWQSGQMFVNSWNIENCSLGLWSKVQVKSKGGL